MRGQNNICLEIKELNKFYGTNHALSDFSYVFTPGVYGLLGENGAGKSTFMSMITDNLKATSGCILFNGENIYKLGRDYRKNLGYVPQQQQVFGGFTLRRFLLYISGLKGIGKKEAITEISNIISQVNLTDVLDRKLSAFSGGMKQRALLAQALLGNPSVIVLDEPTAGLDPNERIRFRNIVSKIASNRIVIIATHVVSDIQFIANRVLIIKRGSIAAEGAPCELCDSIHGKVFEINTDMEDMEELEKKFKIGDMVNNRETVRVRVVSDRIPYGYDYTEVIPNLEDAYLYLVELKNESFEK